MQYNSEEKEDELGPTEKLVKTERQKKNYKIPMTGA